MRVRNDDTDSHASGKHSRDVGVPPELRSTNILREFNRVRDEFLTEGLEQVGTEAFQCVA